MTQSISEQTSPSFDEAAAAWLAAVQAQINAYYARSFKNLTPSVLTLDKPGPKFVRIISTNDGGRGSRSSFGFLELATGNVMKSESWKKPAKTPRANIYRIAEGLGVGPTGSINYLK